MMKRMMNAAGNMKKGSILVAFFVVVGAGVIGRSAYKYFDMKSQRDSIKNEIEQLKDDNARLQEKITNLYNDREYVEKYAREQLDLVKDGETVYIISRD